MSAEGRSSPRARRLHGGAARAAALCALFTLGLAELREARAEPVLIGRYSELRVGSAAGHPYATSGVDVQRRSRTRLRAPAALPARQWSKILPDRRLVPPAVRADGVLLIGGRAGLHALDAQGAALWSAPVGALRFTPALGARGDAVVVADGKLLRVSSEGAVEPLALPQPARGMPLLLDSELVVVGGADGQAHVIGLDGNYLTSVPLADRAPRFSAALGGGLLVLAGHSAALTLLSTSGGVERTVKLPAPLVSNPIATSARTLVAVTDRGSVLEIDAAGALTLWAELGPEVSYGAPALGHDGALRVGLRHGAVTCLAPGGRELWRRGIDGQPSAFTLDAEDSTLVLSSRGTLYLLAQNGEIRWRVSTELAGASRPVLGGDGLLYLVGRGGRLEAWR